MSNHTNIMRALAMIDATGVDQLGRSLNDNASIRAGIPAWHPRMDGEDGGTITQPNEAPVAVEGQVREALNELKGVFEAQFKAVNDRIDAEVKSGRGADPLDVNQLDAIGKRLDEIEAKANRTVIERKQAARASDEYDALQERLERAGLAPASDEAKAAFWNAMAFGLDRINPEQKSLLFLSDRNGDPVERKAMTLANQSTGGFLAPVEFVKEIVKNVRDYSPIRELATVRMTTHKAIEWRKRTQTAGAVWESEGSTTTETQNPAWGKQELSAHKMRAFATVSTEDLEDSAWDLEAELIAEVTESFGIAEGTAFCTGSNIGQPEGLWTNGDIGSVNSGHATQITADGLIDLYFELHERYWANAAWLMRRATFKRARKLKDGEGNYLWEAGLAGTAMPATLLDKPYRIVPDAPAEGADTYPVMFGDYKKGYLIVDRVTMSVKRDEFSNGAAENDDVNFWFRKRVGGAVKQAECIKKLKCAA